MGDFFSVQAGLSLLILIVLIWILIKNIQQPDASHKGFGIIAFLGFLKLGGHLYSTHLFSLIQLVPFTSIALILVAFFQQVLGAWHVSPGFAKQAQFEERKGLTRFKTRPATPFVAGGFILVLILVGLLKDPKVHDSYMMHHPAAALFFVSRPICLGLSIVSLAWSFETLRLSTAGNVPAGVRQAARAGRLAHDFLNLALMVFLAGEIAGSLWSFLGWGTTWRWSRTFFFSAMIFVLFLVSAHTPHKLIQHSGIRQVVACLPVMMVVFFLLISKIG